MGEVAFKDEEIVKKALGLLQREMSLTEYTRFLQLINPGSGDVTKELVEKRKGSDVNTAYKRFLQRIKKA